MKAITPQEADARRKIPDIIIETINELIEQKWNGREATVFQKDIITKLSKHIDSATLFEKRYLDIEEIYEQQGWKVKYDKPGYNEDFEAYFVFERK